MVNWESKEEITKDGVAFRGFVHALLGLFIWEWCTTLWFEWEFLSGRKNFRWPMVFYFLNRYFLLAASIGIAVALNVTSEIDCHALYTITQCLGNASAGLASINLSLRTMAVWNQNKYLVCSLIFLILGQWVPLILHGIQLSAVWVPDIGCVVAGTDTKILTISFIYTMVFDFIIFCLTAFKLLSPAMGHSRLIKLIFHDGLLYFLIAFFTYLLATVFIFLNLNAVMSVIISIPPAVASTIVACRLVRRLNQFDPRDTEVSSLRGTKLSTLAFVHPQSMTETEGIHDWAKQGIVECCH